MRLQHDGPALAHALNTVGKVPGYLNLRCPRKTISTVATVPENFTPIECDRGPFVFGQQHTQEFDQKKVIVHSTANAIAVPLPEL